MSIVLISVKGDKIMHLNIDDRFTIENRLYNNISLKQIGRDINKHPSSVSREIKNHYIIVYLEKFVLIEVEIVILKIVLNSKKKNVLY